MTHFISRFLLGSLPLAMPLALAASFGACSQGDGVTPSDPACMDVPLYTLPLVDGGSEEGLPAFLTSLEAHAGADARDRMEKAIAAGCVTAPGTALTLEPMCLGEKHRPRNATSEFRPTVCAASSDVPEFNFDVCVDAKTEEVIRCEDDDQCQAWNPGATCEPSTQRNNQNKFCALPCDASLNP